MLLYGTPSSSVPEVTRQIIQGWLCLAEEGRPCGICKVCQRGIETPDVLKVHPYGASRTIGIGAVNGKAPAERLPPYTCVTDFTRTLPLVSPFRVTWITHAEKLTNDAANGLLKSIEEPNPHVRFILNATEISRVLPTIVSRCLCVPCHSPTFEVAKADLPNLDEEIWQVAGQDPHQAARYLDDDLDQSILLFAKNLTTKQLPSALLMSQQFRGLIDEYGEKHKLSSREAGAKVLGLLTQILAVLRPEWVAPCAEAHRRILGNAANNYTLDAFFVKILS